MTYEDHIERTAELSQRLDRADAREDFVAVARWHERYMAASDAAEAFCTRHGISHSQFDRDLNARLGLF